MKSTATRLAFFFLLIAGQAFAQDFLGYSISNYAGITGANLNPASIADSRFRFDMELVGFDANVGNNYFGLAKTALRHPAYFKDKNFNSLYLTEAPNNDNKQIYARINLHLPAFMIRINPKNSVGFSIRARAYFNQSGLEPTPAHMIYRVGVFKDSINFLQAEDNKKLNFAYMSWVEYNLTFAHVFLDKEKHFLKAGATLKLLQDRGAAYASFTNVHYKVSVKDTFAYANADVTYGHTNQFSNAGANGGLGGDIGFVYEYRPDYDKYKYDMDGKTNLDMRWKNKYKFRIGFSIVDLGGIHYKKDAAQGDFNINITRNTLPKINLNNPNLIDDTLRKLFKYNQAGNSFYMSLPTALSLQGDYNIYKNFYAGLIGYYAFQFNNTPNSIHETSILALVPRWDHKWFGVFLPVSYNQYKDLNLGVNLRIGPLIIGTNALNSYFGAGYAYNQEVHVLLKVPIPYNRVRDRDKDKISDRKDKCPDTPGTAEFQGCPDRDGDHVPDSEDQCPDNPGPVALHGCPDRDGDGIIDKLDACPDDAGLPQFNGCPDRDGDGIIDKNDECPDQPGLAQNKGCPDRDGDDVIDKLDDCPDKAGPAENHGCPEIFLLVMDDKGNVIRKIKQNKDGTFTYNALPTEANVIFGIEGTDTDTLKEIDLLVNGASKKIIRGSDKLFHLELIKQEENKMSSMEENDVPIKLTKAEAIILKKAFSNLEFETSKDVIKKESYTSLDELADMLKKKPEWKLKLSGHTDNSGSKEENMKLSEKRARAVAKYLAGESISESRFKILWFGSTKPIAPNTTPAGRQKNRRVEMVIID
jgi:outer membrane protein OmpA-like peptidoglycan-associated protein